MKQNWKTVALKLLGGTLLGLALGGMAGIIVGGTFYLVKKNQMDNHHPSNMSLLQWGQEIIATIGNVLTLFILPAVCVFYGAVGGALTGLLTTLLNRSKLVGALMGAGIGTAMFLFEWFQPSELLPYASTAIPLEAFIGWLIAKLFVSPSVPPPST